MIERVIVLSDKRDPNVCSIAIARFDHSGQAADGSVPTILCRVPTELANEIGTLIARWRGREFVPRR
jgi:hypothetical protein